MADSNTAAAVVGICTPLPGFWNTTPSNNGYGGNRGTGGGFPFRGSEDPEDSHFVVVVVGVPTLAVVAVGMELPLVDTEVEAVFHQHNQKGAENVWGR